MSIISAKSIYDFKQNPQDFCIIDIRGKQAFLGAHLRDSHNASDISQVISLLESNIYSPPPTICPPPDNPSKNNLHKPLLILCFSSVRAKSFAQSLAKNSDFLALYGHNRLYYLECGIMEAYDAGLEILQGNDNALAQHTSQNNIAQRLPPQTKQTAQITQQAQDPQKSQESNPLIAQTIATLKQKYLATKKAWVVTFSGGKDSTCVLQLVYEMLVALPPHLRRPTYAIASNTLVEAPHIDRFLHAVIDSINAHAKAHNIPFEVIIVEPSLKDDFWVNLIGKGYPSPTRTFRWCTERLKINPAKAQVAKITQKFGSCILLLGSRKAESTNRKKSIEKRILNEDGYSQHHDFPDTLTYSPIAEWDTDSVWGYLLSHKPLWDKDHSELFALYSKASGEECQFITDLAQSSCGGSRFGCWVCTVVNEDKSMQGFISTGEAHLKPLNEFRNYIKELREDSDARADYKRDGRAVYKVGGLGPFLSHIRVDILERLLSAEREFLDSKKGAENATNARQNLISDEQILEIQAQWSKDFDLSHTAITIAQKFNRLKGVKMEKSNILHKEILQEVVKEKIKECGNTIECENVENLISKTIDICANIKKNRANTFVMAEIEKLLDDKTAKQSEES